MKKIGLWRYLIETFALSIMRNVIAYAGWFDRIERTRQLSVESGEKKEFKTYF